MAKVKSEDKPSPGLALGGRPPLRTRRPQSGRHRAESRCLEKDASCPGKNAPCLTALPPFSPCWRGHGQADQEPGVAALRALRWLRFERADIQKLRADMNTKSQQLREDMGQLRADNKYSRDY